MYYECWFIYLLYREKNRIFKFYFYKIVQKYLK